MFGQQNDKPDDENKIPEHSIDGALNADQDTSQTDDQGEPKQQSESNENNDRQEQNDLSDGTLSETDNSPGTPDFQHPGTPLDEQKEKEESQPEPQLVTPDVTPPENVNPASDHHQPVGPSSASPNDLLDIKQKALGQLTPLVGHLDQSPEDKFRTTMMMIQASDDQSLVQTAYDAAQKIENEKVRAQALLDIVNEINYFTQHTEQ